MDFQIEKGIGPLVEALNGLGFVSTVYSCEGHFDGEQREKFLPTAYVTFDVSDVDAFAGLHERLRAFDDAAEAARLRLTFDCILGRYTLSVWPDARSERPSRKRAVVDAAVARLAHLVREHTAGPLGNDSPGYDRRAILLPCAGSVPPCTLVIPPNPLLCPFAESPHEQSEDQR